MKPLIFNYLPWQRHGLIFGLGISSGCSGKNEPEGSKTKRKDTTREALCSTQTRSVMVRRQSGTYLGATWRHPPPHPPGGLAEVLALKKSRECACLPGLGLSRLLRDEATLA